MRDVCGRMEESNEPRKFRETNELCGNLDLDVLCRLLYVTIYKDCIDAQKEFKLTAVEPPHHAFSLSEALVLCLLTMTFLRS